ncbi:sugar ABC transporter ATP-binding protein [Herbiconiux daphne]|uniref:Sugar ABC transporter ATP-binding protein n=1 Tax=Herbiconiux daphne TaxID=2970914 RepID=A0ABT2H466_9MICO|nr:sugar ABC transporter ATP-binding protein [Herbiconiux daphne]MCS5734723.1 sugar ABC transporter ATP-binding protein [Herbiconiux daphne]
MSAAEPTVAQTSTEAPALRLTDVSKSFGVVNALTKVSLEIRPREVVGLIGENGAGKSSLLKILSGNQTADSGTMELRGRPVTFSSISQAMSNGVAMVYQEQSLLPNVSVAENILLGNERGAVRDGFYRWKQMHRTAQRHLDEVKSGVSPSDITDTLPFAQRQMVEVAKALATGDGSPYDPVILLDEPTSVLESGDIETLFSVIRRVKEHASIVFVSHRLEEVLEICDRVYVMRDGEVVAEVDPAEADVDQLFRLMVGRDLTSGYFREDLSTEPTPDVRLAIESLTGPGFSDVSLGINRGEIVSILGVQDSGRENLGRVLFGALPAAHGSVRIDGERVGLRSTRDAVARGIGYLPSERKIDGAIMGMSVADNMTLAHPDVVSTLGVMRSRRVREVADEWIRRLAIKTSGPAAEMVNLSGGNQQKVVLAKWMLAPDLRVLILDTPTRGLDVGAKSEVYAILHGLAAKGVSIILLADSLEEGIYVSHRVITMADGKVTGEFTSRPGNRPSRTSLIERML